MAKKIVCPKCGSSDVNISVEGTGCFRLNDFEFKEDGGFAGYPTANSFDASADAAWHADCGACEHKWEVPIEE